MKHIGRKLYHLFGGLGLLSLYYILGREQALVFYAVLFCIMLALDVLRLKVPSVNRFVYDRFRSFIRKSEEKKLTGTPAYIAGIGLSLFLFPDSIAAAAVCFLACGDVAATAVGERYGRRKIRDKSLEGTLAFIVAAAAAGFLLTLANLSVPYGIVFIGAVAAAGIELLPLRLNDNLVIPLASGGVMLLVSWLAGCA